MKIGDLVYHFSDKQKHYLYEIIDFGIDSFSIKCIKGNKSDMINRIYVKETPKWYCVLKAKEANHPHTTIFK